MTVDFNTESGEYTVTLKANEATNLRLLICVVTGGHCANCENRVDDLYSSTAWEFERLMRIASKVTEVE
jgi:hypothetical protein